MTSKVFAIFCAVASLVLFFIPCISFIAFVLFVRGFVPDMRVAQWDHWYSLAAAGVLLIAISPIWLQQFKDKKNFKSRFKAIAMAIVAPLFYAALFHSFVVGPCAYTMHVLSSPKESAVIEKVESASSGGKSCRNKLNLSGSEIFFQRVVCGVKAEDINRWRNGGSVQLYGRQTKYGFQVDKYRHTDG